MKNSFFKKYGVFLICIGLINPSIHFYVAWYFMPLAAVFSIPSLGILFAVYLIQGIYFYTIGSSQKSINKILSASVMIGMAPNILVTINGFVSLMSVLNHTSIESANGAFSSFISDNGFYILILNYISIATLIVGAVTRCFTRNGGIVTETETTRTYKPHTQLVIKVIVLILVLAGSVLIFNFFSSKKNDFISDQIKNDTISETPSPGLSQGEEIKDKSVLGKTDSCQPLSLADQEKYDSFLRNPDTPYDFYLQGIGKINLASDKAIWMRKVVERGEDPAAYNYSTSNLKINFLDLNGDCKYDAVVTMTYASDPSYKSETDQYPIWKEEPLMYVFINRNGSLVSLGHIRYEDGMKITSIEAVQNKLTVNINFHIEKDGNSRTRKVQYDVSSGKLVFVYDSYDDVSKWASAWESGVDRISGITFNYPGEWGAVKDTIQKPPLTKEEETVQIQSGRIPIVSGNSHTLSFARYPISVIVYSVDYREKPISEIPAELVTKYLAGVKNQDSYLRRPASFQCYSNNLNPKHSLLRCEILYQDNSNVIIRAGAIETGTLYPDMIAMATVVPSKTTENSYGLVSIKAPLSERDVFSEYISESVWENTPRS